MKRKTIAESFDEQYIVDAATRCYVWQRARDKDGYGKFWLCGKLVRANRYAYERAAGPLACGMQACHTCDNPPCVNPEHLFAGTNSDNVKDAIRKGRAAAPVFHGAEHGMAILDTAQVLSIRAKLAAGTRQCDVAREFSISEPLVYRIKKRIIWKHV
ncbi:MAG: HNH endonuclease [Steroidobacteraceae bacterium]